MRNCQQILLSLFILLLLLLLYLLIHRLLLEVCTTVVKCILGTVIPTSVSDTYINEKPSQISNDSHVVIFFNSKKSFTNIKWLACGFSLNKKTVIRIMSIKTMYIAIARLQTMEKSFFPRKSHLIDFYRGTIFSHSHVRGCHMVDFSNYYDFVVVFFLVARPNKLTYLLTITSIVHRCRLRAPIRNKEFYFFFFRKKKKTKN